MWWSYNEEWTSRPFHALNALHDGQFRTGLIRGECYIRDYCHSATNILKLTDLGPKQSPHTPHIPGAELHMFCFVVCALLSVVSSKSIFDESLAYVNLSDDLVQAVEKVGIKEANTERKKPGSADVHGAPKCCFMAEGQTFSAVLDSILYMQKCESADKSRFGFNRSCTSGRAAALDEKLLNICICDLKPLNFTEGNGSKNLMNFVEPSYKLPSHSKIAHLLRQKADLYLDNVRSVVRENPQGPQSMQVPTKKKKQHLKQFSALEKYKTVVKSTVNASAHKEEKTVFEAVFGAGKVQNSGELKLAFNKVEDYINSNSMPVENKSILEYWKQNASTFPRLAIMAHHRRHCYNRMLEHFVTYSNPNTLMKKEKANLRKSHKEKKKAEFNIKHPKR
uniref:HAT C-terminal dimerisation domain-containing protein n=1 Tax=Romanomermis culicivorax TaxID=13658 RepID=A0A915J2X8_ROMCU